MKYFLIIIFIFLLLGHIFAILISAYWNIWWYDNMMHFMGGLWVGSLALWFIYDIKKIKAPEWNYFFITIIILSFVSFIGVLWEFFEFSFDTLIGYKKFADIAQLGLKDTMSDLFFDLIGGYFAAVIFKNKIQTRK